MRAAWVAVAATILISACGGGGTDTGNEPAPAPTLTLSATPTQVTRGQTTTLAWSSGNASACQASGSWSGARATSGSEAVTVSTTSASASYQLDCSGSGGSVSRTVTVTVTAPGSAPSLDLTITPASIRVGEAATLGWTGQNVNGCVASQSWAGNRGTTGSESTGAISAAGSYGYELACSGAGGTATRSVTLTVAAPPPAAGTTFSLTATATAPGDAAIDRDTADATTSNGDNDDFATAQILPNPFSLGGFATEAGDGLDFYRLPLSAGQRVELYVAEDGEANDLDLFLADAAGNLVASSVSTSNRESVEAPSGGDYFVVVEAFQGASNYVAVSVQAGTAADAGGALRHGMRSQSPVIPGRWLIELAEGVPGVAGGVLSSLGLAPAGVVSEQLREWRSADLAGLAAALRVPAPRLAGTGLVGARMESLRLGKRLSRLPGIRAVAPVFQVQGSRVPNDPEFSRQWHYGLINLPAAWDVTTGSATVIVGVADTGVVLGHPDLIPALDPNRPNGYDFISDASNSLDGDGRDANADDPGDSGPTGQSSFHGTHVAGTVAAATNNGSGVAGAGFNSRIMALRVLGEGGGSSTDILAAVRYASGLSVGGVQAPVAASILNLSLGCDSCYSQSEAQVYREVIARGLMVVAAAGNSGDDGNPIGYPASYDGVVSVAATGPSQSGAPRRARYSQFNRHVDVAAPGGDTSVASNAAGAIYSTSATGFGSGRRAAFAYLEGTSMATPHLAGVVALMKAVFPGLTPARLDQMLASGQITRDLGATGRDNEFGHGLIDAALAVRAAQAAAGGTPAPDNPQLVVNPRAAEFGSSRSSQVIEAANSGTGTLSAVNASDDAPWLTATVGTASGGVFPVTLSVNRAGLSAGAYSATVTLRGSFSGGSSQTVTVPVSMQVGGGSSVADAGVHYFLLADADSLEVIDQQRVAAASGRYAVQFSGVAPGRYLLVGGTDSDEDGFICDEGEACAVYATPDSPSEIDLRTASRSGLQFATGFDLAFLAASARHQGQPPPAGAGRGFRLRPRAPGAAR